MQAIDLINKFVFLMVNNAACIENVHIAAHRILINKLPSTYLDL